MLLDLFITIQASSSLVAWTLCEVVKLVDGVARFGAGKWSMIRKLSFASYFYRTSVDLKVCLLVQPKLTAISFSNHTLKPAAYSGQMA
jgi:hypothetical protein